MFSFSNFGAFKLKLSVTRILGRLVKFGLEHLALSNVGLIRPYFLTRALIKGLAKILVPLWDK